MKNLFNRIVTHLRKYYMLVVSLKKDNTKTELQENEKMKEMGWITSIILWCLSIFRVFIHKPLNTCVQYFKHTIETKTIFTNKVIKIELVKKENLGLNKKVTITDILFALNYKTHDNKVHSITIPDIDIIDKKYLTLKENDDIVEFSIKIPFHLYFKFYTYNEIQLLIGLHSALKDDFKLIDDIDLKNDFINPITKHFEKIKELDKTTGELEKQREYNKYIENKLKEQNPWLIEREPNEEQENLLPTLCL